MKINFMNDIKNLWKNKLIQILLVTFAVIFGIIKSLSEHIYLNNEINIDAKFLIYSIICYLLLNIAYYVITHNYDVKSVKIKSLRKLWWIFFAVLLLTYTICWVTYWPGTISIDNWYIAKSGESVSNQHPLAYCLLISFFVNLGTWLGSINYSIILYTFIQIFISCAFISTILTFIFSKKINHLIKWLIFAFYVFVPVYAMFSITSVKDVYWAMGLSTLTLLSYILLHSDKKIENKKFWIIFTLSMAVVVLLRNNGIHIIAVYTTLLLYILPKQRKYLFYSLCISFIALSLSIWRMNTLGASQLFQEKIGIPLQQIAAVVKNDGILNDEQRTFINQIMPLKSIKEQYNPYTVDTIKWSDGRAKGYNPKFLEENKSEFFKNWISILPNNFVIYVKAYLQATYWFWAPRQQQGSFTNTIFPKNNHPLMQWILENNGDPNSNILPTNIQKLLQTNYYNFTPYFFREGVLFWLLAGCALLYYIKNKSLKDIIIYLPCLLLWVTLMIATPIAQQFRYILPFAYLLPFFVALLFIDKNTDDNEIKLVSDKPISQKAKKQKKYIKLFSIMFLGICLLSYTIWYLTIGHPITARIDLYTNYVEEPSFITIRNNQSLAETDWINKFGKRGVVIQKKDKKDEFLIITFVDTDITIALLGPDKRDENGKPIEKWVKYTDFRINDEKILSKPVNVWHNNQFKHILKTKKHKLYKIQIKWRKK